MAEAEAETESEHGRPRGIGTRRFWSVAATIALVAFFVLGFKYCRASNPDALVPVVTITGPGEVTPGETARYAVLVRDRFGAPIPRAPVRIGFWKNGLTELGRGVTGDGGEAAIEVPFPKDFDEQRTLVAVADVGVAAGDSGTVVQPRRPEPGSFYVSTDKPLYQPGQTIHIRALAMAGDKPIGERPAVIEVRTGDPSIKVFRVEKPTSAFGVISADFVLADQVKLGSYRISVGFKRTPNEAPSPYDTKVYGDRIVEVKRYSLPKLKVAFEDLSPFLADGPLTGKVHATWIFGEPVTKGKVSVSVGQRAASGKLDKDGVFSFELAPLSNRRPSEQPRGSFTLAGTVFVEGGLMASTSTTLSTTERNTIKLEAFPESGPLIVGHAQKIYVVATGEGPAARAGISVRALPDGPIAKTSDRGIAIVNVTPPIPPPQNSPRPVQLFAFKDDGSEGKLEVPIRSNALVIRPDRDSYGAGDTARVTVFGADAGDHIAIRVTKGTQPVALASCVVSHQSAGCEAALPFPKTLSGLVWIHALSLPGGRRDVKVGKRLALVAGGDRDLTLKLTPDRAVHAPRETGAVDVAVTGVSGAPVKAQLGVAVADEAVFALGDVRPDLEKVFFTIDKDLEKARRGGRYDDSPFRNASSSTTEAHPPAELEATAAYQPQTPDDVRGIILAALSTMPEVGGVDASTSSEIAARASGAVGTQKHKLGGWLIIVLSLLSLAAFGCFGLYAVARFRRPRLLPGSPEDAETFRLEMRGLHLDWFIAALGPPLLAIFGGAAADVFDAKGSAESVFGTWGVIAWFFAAVLLVRAVLRVRRTSVSRSAEPLRRAIVFLPVAAFTAHTSIVLIVADKGRNLRELFDYPHDSFVVPLLVIIAAQLTTGLLSVIRQTLLRPVSLKGRIWLLLSRASFVGLPVSLVGGGAIVMKHVQASRVSWAEYFQEQQQTEQVEPNADNKEGGTGTRAKGEEGSMGNPNTNKRYAVQGPRDNGGSNGVAGRTAITVRDFFPETLLWAPDIITDDAGHAKVNVPFADSITTWRFGLKAVSLTGQLGSTTIPLVVKQDFFVDASLPPALTQGDEVTMPVSVFSYMESAQDITLEIEGDGTSTMGPAKSVLHLAPREVRGIPFRVRFDKAGDRVVRVKASGSTRADALARKVIVVPNGMAFTRTVDARLVGSTSTDAVFPPQAIDGGNDLYVKVYGGPLSQVSEGLDGVFKVPHGCFEQTASTTYPSILVLDFLRRSKAASPEVEKKAREYIAQGVQRLVSFETWAGGFSLFGSGKPSIVLSAYGLMLFSDLANVSDVDTAVLTRARSWLYGQRNASGGWPKPGYDAKGNPAAGPDDLLTTAYVAWALASVSLPELEKDTKLASVLDVVENAKGPEAEEPYALVLRANALLAGGRTAQARPLLDRLATQATRDDEGVHWKSNALGVMYSYGPSMNIEVTGLASHAFAQAALQPELRNGALSWLVRRRGSSGTWSTTQATIAAMRALLDEARPAPKEPQDITVLVDGATAETFRLEPAARDVHRLFGLRKAATTGKHTVEVRASGSADVSYQLVATHWLPWQKQPGASPLSLEVDYTPAIVATGGSISARVRLAWKGKEPARMPLVELSVPPAFEAETEELDKLVATPGDDARVRRYTLERGVITLYLVDLPADKPFTLDVPMRALRPARVVTPSSSAYLYYEPEVRAETAPVVVRATL